LRQAQLHPRHGSRRGAAGEGVSQRRLRDGTAEMSRSQRAGTLRRVRVAVQHQRRQATVVAYLNQARGRKNLTIVDRAQVHSLKLSGKKAEGVNYERDDEMHTALGGQILITSGVYGSPQILMLSGIGPSAELKKFGIPIVHELNGIGENYQD